MFTTPWVDTIIADSPYQLCFQKDYCLRYRLSNFQCEKCLSSCPQSAISLREGKIIFDRASCTSCLLCHAACPADAFTLPGLNTGPISQIITNQQEVTFICSRHTQRDPQHYVIPCVGIFSPALLLVLGLSQLSKITINISHCKSCDNLPACTQLINSIEILKTVSRYLNFEKFHLETEKEKLTPEGNKDRRYFLFTLASEVKSIAKSHLKSKACQTDKPKISKRYIPFKTKLIFEAACKNDSENETHLDFEYFYQLRVSEKCNLCPLCTGICPTGSVKVIRKDGEKQLLFNRSICSGCGLCVSFCKKGALTLTAPQYLPGNGQSTRSDRQM